MKIAKNAIGAIEYELTDDAGEVIDSSKGRPPLTYLHGAGNLIPGLESELEGKAKGATFKVRIAPEDAYGLRDETIVEEVARSQFPADAELEVGMQFQAQASGGTRVVTVVGVEGDSVRLDGNHPLAGVPLNFAVTVVGVREATAEELNHGHPHGPEGHHH